MRNPKQIRSKTLLFTAIAVLSNVLGNFALSRGMREVGPLLTVSIGSLLNPLLNLWVAAGVCLLAIWLVSQLSLLSWADLSYVIPLTGSSYVLTALLGALVLRENVSTAHWIGIGLISLGVMLVGKTSPQTVPVHSAEPGE